eukprot:CAMPEP_0168331060 /NCGR_PEP_ID=MMETSP0213-20121227/8106_1 /TAXON_ID=151035 /ORGANISM="Euplotes harpa, Strain FSP1.4" /LENGTH=152 /DNA_ID=CAMNT_0008334759 /DNA_START=440 /DNA_END=898 /DNA_ORIENTATION=-
MNSKPVGLDGDTSKPGVDMKEIDIGIKQEERKTPAIGGGPLPPRSADLKKDKDEDLHDEDPDGYDNEGKPFFTQVVERYPKSIIWYFMLLAFASHRAAVPFAIAIAYLSLIGRAVQIVGAVINKPLVCYIGYGISVFILIMLYGVVMINEAD